MHNDSDMRPLTDDELDQVVGGADAGKTFLLAIMMPLVNFFRALLGAPPLTGRR
jgi:bacteriocin-like protein